MDLVCKCKFNLNPGANCVYSTRIALAVMGNLYPGIPLSQRSLVCPWPCVDDCVTVDAWVTVDHVSLWTMCHCTPCVTVDHVSLWTMWHCSSCVTVEHVSLWTMCHCGPCATVDACVTM